MYEVETLDVFLEDLVLSFSSCYRMSRYSSSIFTAVSNALAWASCGKDAQGWKYSFKVHEFKQCFKNFITFLDFQHENLQYGSKEFPLVGKPRKYFITFNRFGIEVG